MTVDGALELLRNVVLICIQSAGPPIMAALLVGVFVSIMQTATQIQEQSITFIFKLLGVATVMMLVGPDVLRQIIEYMRHSFVSIAGVVR